MITEKNRNAVVFSFWETAGYLDIPLHTFDLMISAQRSQEIRDDLSLGSSSLGMSLITSDEVE